jgi:polysaccharide biosynthesis protein PslJ
VTFPIRFRPDAPTDTRRLLWLGAVGLVTVAATLSALIHPLVGVVVVLACLTAPVVLVHRTLALATVASVVVLLPFAAIPLGIGFNPTLLDLALAVVYVIWTVRLVTRAQGETALATPLGVAVALFMGLAAVAFVVGMGQSNPTKNQMRTFGELALSAGLFVIVPDLVTDRTSLRRLFLAVVGLGTVAALVGLVLYMVPDEAQIRLLSFLRVLDYPAGPAVLRFINDDPTRLQRATGTSVDPNAFGGMLAVVAAFLLPQLVSRAPLLPRRVAALMTGVVALAILATVSRAAFVGWVSAAALVAFARDRRLLLALAAAGLVALVSAALLPWSRAYVEHFVQGLVGADRATQMRYGEYRDALRLIARYPVFGVGFGDVRDADLYRGVSSLYLLITVSMGLVGLGAFLALVGGIAVRLGGAWRCLPPAEPTRSVVLGSLAALVAVLVSGAFDHYFFSYPHEFALLWLVLGTGYAAARIAAAGPPGLAAGE